MADITICGLCKKQLCMGKLLPCLDSFCLSCLEDIAQDKLSGDKLICPSCEDTFQIPDKGLDALPANSFVDGLLRYRKSGQEEKEPSCDVCDSGAEESTSYCLDCSQSMCQQCSSYHLKFTGTKEHNIVPRGSELGASVRCENTDRCELHENRRQELYCTDCGSAICLKCFTTNHSSHACSDLAITAGEYNKQMHQIVDQMEQLATKNHSEEHDLRRARDSILDQITSTEFMVQRSREELVSCIEQDTVEVMNDLQYFRETVTAEYSISSDKIRKRAEKICNFKEFTSEVVSEGSASTVANVASAVKQRASDIQAENQKFHTKKRPLVEVTFQPLGLSNLSQARNRRKINLVGMVTATIASPDLEHGNMRPTLQLPKHREPVFEFTARNSSGLASSGNQISRHSHVALPQLKRGKKFLGARSLHDLHPSHWQMPQSNKSPSPSSSSDEDNIEESDDDDALTGPGAEAKNEDETKDSESVPKVALETVENKFDFSSASIIFSHKAKLYRFCNGSWHMRGIGNMNVVRLQDKNAFYFVMTKQQTQRICLKQLMSSDLSLEPVPESEGRALTWIIDAGPDADGHYDMLLVKFRSKTVAADFRMAVVCAGDLMLLGQHSATAAATNTAPISTVSVTPSSSSSSSSVAMTTSTPVSAATSRDVKETLKPDTETLSFGARPRLRPRRSLPRRFSRP